MDRHVYRCMKVASNLSLSLFAVFSLLACGAESGRFRVEGRFRNLNRGEFYIYSLDGSTNGLDTIKVSDGRFAYETDLSDKATYIILFPNMSEQVVFGESGATVKIAGDASHLKEMEVTGSDDNELMTKFRQNVNRLSPPEATREAAVFIKEHPESPLSEYILRKYFILTASPDYAQAASLLSAMIKATPDNGRLIRQKRGIDRLKAARIGSTMPNFSATTTNGQRIGKKQLSARVNVVNAWASWSHDSQNLQRQLDKLKKAHNADIALLGICLDARVSDCDKSLEHDSIKWPNVCDGRMWETPLLGKFGIGTVPGNVVFDRTGKVVACNLNSQQMKEKIESLLKEK